MIIIGEKLNGSIPSVAKAIAEKDADLIRERAQMQPEAGATFLDVCASVEEDMEVIAEAIDLCLTHKNQDKARELVIGLTKKYPLYEEYNLMD